MQSLKNTCKSLPIIVQPLMSGNTHQGLFQLIHILAILMPSMLLPAFFPMQLILSLPLRVFFLTGTCFSLLLSLLLLELECLLCLCTCTDIAHLPCNLPLHSLRTDAADSFCLRRNRRTEPQTIPLRLQQR